MEPRPASPDELAAVIESAIQQGRNLDRVNDPSVAERNRNREIVIRTELVQEDTLSDVILPYYRDTPEGASVFMANSQARRVARLGIGVVGDAA